MSEIKKMYERWYLGQFTDEESYKQMHNPPITYGDYTKRYTKDSSKYDAAAVKKAIDDAVAAVRNCKHEYKTYTGLTETFEYCARCDRRKDDL